MAWYVVKGLEKLLGCLPSILHVQCLTTTQSLPGVKEETERKVRGARKPVWYVARAVAAAMTRRVSTRGSPRLLPSSRSAQDFGGGLAQGGPGRSTVRKHSICIETTLLMNKTAINDARPPYTFKVGRL